MTVTQQQQQLTPALQTLQDSGYGGTDKRPVPRSEDYDGAGDKENSSPNRKVCDNNTPAVRSRHFLSLLTNYTYRLLVPAKLWPRNGLHLLHCQI